MGLGASCMVGEMVVAEEKVGRRTRGSIARAGFGEVRSIARLRVPCV